MDAVIVAAKLESLRRCVRRIETRRAESAEALAEDFDRQDILVLNLTRAVQLCVDVGANILAGTERQAPGTMGETFDLLAEEGVLDVELARRLRSAVGFRNIAVHSYRSIDWWIVHELTTTGVEDLRAFAAAIGRMLDEG
jgi:uncharacterized protein YutE (UPF0331/DUF86 family)